MADLLVGYFVANKQANTLTIVNHGLLNGDTVRFALGAPGNTLPSPLVENVWYYVVSAASDTFQVALTSGGPTIVLTDNGTGSNEAWSPSPTTDVWVYELLSVPLTEPELLPDISDVNTYAERGWELYYMAQGNISGGHFWFMMRKTQPLAAP